MVRHVASNTVNNWWDEHLKWQCISNCHLFRLVIQCYCFLYRTYNLSWRSASNYRKYQSGANVTLRLHKCDVTFTETLIYAYLEEDIANSMQRCSYTPRERQAYVSLGRDSSAHRPICRPRRVNSYKYVNSLVGVFHQNETITVFCVSFWPLSQTFHEQKLESFSRHWIYIISLIRNTNT